MTLLPAGAAALATWLAACSPKSTPTADAARWERPASEQGPSEQAHPVGCKQPGTNQVELKVLGLNDFHGQLAPEVELHGRPAGSARVLYAYLQEAVSDYPNRWLLLDAGDLVGASPPISALLQDEPAIHFLNLFGNDACDYQRQLESSCNVVGVVGNHDFDEGAAELMRLLHGGNHPSGPFLQDPYRGTRYPAIAANITRHSKQLLPSYAIVEVAGVKVGVIGAVTDATPYMILSRHAKELRFANEAASVNAAAQHLETEGVHVIIAAVHEGGSQSSSYSGPTRDGEKVTGPIADIVAQLSNSVDLVVSGHQHQFINARLPNAAGNRVLVTQAYSLGKAFADIDVTIDCQTQEMTETVARIVPTYVSSAPSGISPNKELEQLLAAAKGRTDALESRVVATVGEALSREPNFHGESELGNLIADSFRHAMQSDLAFMNPGGIRADLDKGAVTWGELFTMQPFSNRLVRLRLSGSEILRLLEAQWRDRDSRVLQISGFGYTWDGRLPPGKRVVDVRLDNKAVKLRDFASRQFSVTVNEYMANGRAFPILAEAQERLVGPNDLQAMIDYIKSLPSPFASDIEGRIRRADGKP